MHDKVIPLITEVVVFESPQKFSFSRSQRILKRQDFQLVFEKSKRLYGIFYTAYYCFNNLNRARLGVVVSKRNAKNAVSRNRIRRMAREVFRIQSSTLEALDVVLVAQKKSNSAKKEELKACLEQLFSKLKK